MGRMENKGASIIQSEKGKLERFLSDLRAFLTSRFYRQTASSRKLVCDLKRFTPENKKTLSEKR